MDRRTAITAAIGIVTAGLAGCAGGGGGGNGNGDENGDGGASPTATAAPHTRSETPEQSASSTPSPSASPTDRPPTVRDTTTAPAETATPTATPTQTSTAAQVVDVGPGGSLRFEPDEFTIATGETVRWVWQSGGHNVKVAATPDGADWRGTPGAEFDTFSAGHTYSHTFAVAGDYEYYCAPHRGAGMTGTFTVE